MRKALIHLDDYRPEQIIRTETVFTRFPLHQLAKSGRTKIEITRVNSKGKLTTLWEVTENSKYGAPGILAYKVDTIVINRRFDEIGFPLPEVIHVGTLEQVCEMLGLSKNGTNYSHIKKAFLQNASAFITADLHYNGNSGSDRYIKLGCTRYSVIFTGQKMPDGKKANGVYLLLHPHYRAELNKNKIRPLDYDYLKKLTPSSQRLYELISFEIFAALSHDNPRARMRYSELCRFAPLTQYWGWERVKKQLYKIHKPHLRAKYIEKVEFETAQDSEGRADWWIYYTPGVKARAEFRSSQDKKFKLQLKTYQSKASELSESELALVKDLVSYGVTEQRAREVVAGHREAAERELEAFPYRDRSKIKDPAAWLIKAIESGRYSQPVKVEEKRWKRTADQSRKGREEAEQKYRGEYMETYLRPMLAYLEAVNSELFEYYESRCASMDKLYPECSEEDLALWKLCELEVVFAEYPDSGFLTFWQWLQESRPEVR